MMKRLSFLLATLLSASVFATQTVELDTDVYALATADATFQPLDADLTAWAGVTPGTGVEAALAVNVGTAGSFVVNGGALGTPSSGTLTNATGLPVSTGISGLGSNVATFLATPTSANFFSAVTGESGSGAVLGGTSPTLDGTITITNAGAGTDPTLTSNSANQDLAVTGNLDVSGGIDIGASQSFSVNGTDIVADAAGTATLSNIDAVDATTKSTLESGLDFVLDSEVDADIKTLDLPASTTITAYAQTFLDDANEATFKATVNLEAGTDVQAWDADLDTYAGITPSANVQSLMGAADYAAMRGLLDLEAGTDFYSISAADTAFVDTTGGDTMAPTLTISDSATTPPLNLTERAAEPSAPSSGDIYLDDGTNTNSGNPGLRRYTGVGWEDINDETGGGGDVTAVGDCASGDCFTGASGTTLSSNTDLIMALDEDNDGTESFQILDGADAAVLEVEESGNVNVTAGDVVFTEKADHTSTPGAGFGYLWVKNSAPNVIYFTDDAGTDYDLTAGAGGSGDITAVGNCTTGDCFTGATGTTLTSNTDLIFDLDDNADGSESFQIRDGADIVIAEIAEGPTYTYRYDGSSYWTDAITSTGQRNWTSYGSSAGLAISMLAATDGDFQVNSSQLYVDTSTGHVGISADTPDERLEIIDSSDVQLMLTQSDATVYSTFQVDSNGDLLVNVDGQSNQLVLDNGGGIGIGTAAPNGVLDVQGDEAFLPGPNAAPADGDFANSQWSMWLDETNDEFELKAKKADGTVISQTVTAQLHMAKMTQSTGQSFPNNTLQKVTFDGEEFDIGDISDYTTNDRIDISKSGIYYVTGQVGFDGFESGERIDVKIYKNGSKVMFNRTAAYGAGAYAFADVEGALDLEAGDYIELYALQAEGGTQDTVAADTRLSVIQLNNE